MAKTEYSEYVKAYEAVVALGKRQEGDIADESDWDILSETSKEHIVLCLITQAAKAANNQPIYD